MPHSTFRSVIAWFRAIGVRFLDEPVTATDPGGAVGMSRAARYRAAVNALPAETRRIFLLHRADGLDIRAIAKRTGQPTGAVERYIADAIFTIWAALDGDQP